MDVQNYLKTALRQIAAGVSEANDQSSHSFELKKGGAIKFDLAVINKVDRTGKLRLEVLALGGKAKKEVSNETISKVKFEVTYAAQEKK